MTDSLSDKLQALASELSAEGLPSIARRIDAILDAEQDETAAPEGQPEGSEHDCYRCPDCRGATCCQTTPAAPAPVPDDEALLARVVTTQMKDTRWRDLTPLAVAKAILASDWLAEHTQALEAALADARAIARLATESETGWRREAEELAVKRNRLRAGIEALADTWDAMRARNGRPMLTTANVVDRLRALLGGEA